MIRAYQKKDFRYIQDLCMADFGEDDSPSNRAYHCSLCCDYYMDNQAEFCLISVDGDDIPVGYVLCCADVDDYYENMTEYYLPLVRKVNSEEYFKFNAFQKVTQRYIRQGYTAHFRIATTSAMQDDVKQLIEMLCAKLKETNVEGVYVLCEEKDDDAVRLYEDLGFDDIDHIRGAVVYGKKFFEED